MMGTRSTIRLTMSFCCVDSHSLATLSSPGNEVPILPWQPLEEAGPQGRLAHCALFVLWVYSFLLL